MVFCRLIKFVMKTYSLKPSEWSLTFGMVDKFVTKLAKKFYHFEGQMRLFKR